MKYSELMRKLKKAGCYDTGREISGHPAWYSPITKKYFAVSHHGNQEVAKGTLKNILEAAGLK
ncbi:MAG: type II toxin-antitoxin system HicA family toxin [Alistipes sp.]|nr:type II toxin-antitoxin system HicA family toxin [Alistipes sp.]